VTELAGPLARVRVCDFTGQLAGAGATRYLAAFGAEVIRIEDPVRHGRWDILRGMSPWILKDFRSPRRQNPLFQQGWNRKGLISETGPRKQAFEVLAEHYRRLEKSAP